MRLVAPDRRDLFAVAAFAVFTGILLLATPIAVQALVNFVALGGALPPLIVVVLLLFLGLCFAGVLSAFQTWIVEILQRRLFVRLVADLSARLPRVALRGLEGQHGPELVNRFFDVMAIQKTGSFLLLDGLSVLLSVLVGLVVLAFYHPLLLAFDIILLGVIALIVLGPVRRGIRTATDESSAKYSVAAWLEEITRNPVLLRSSGAAKYVYERSDRLARAYVDRRGTHFRVVFSQSIAALALQAIASTVLLGIGGLLVIRGSLTLGQLVAAELIVTLVVTSVAKMGKHIEAFYDLMAAVDKVGRLLDLPVEDGDGEEQAAEATTGGVEVQLRSLSWLSHDSSKRSPEISMKIKPGERVGIRGHVGGRSSLLELIWGLSEPSTGSIRLDGHDLREQSLEASRRGVSLVDRVEILEATVRENVRGARSDVSRDDVRKALESVGLLSDLEHLSDGLDTRLTPDGRPLSAEQQCRLQVARAVAGRPRLLLVSDMFGGVAPAGRQRLLDTLFHEDAPWTLLLLSHSEDVLARCDRVLELPRSEHDGSLGGDAAPSPSHISSS